MVDEEIVKKGELLRDLYLIQEHWTKYQLDFAIDMYDAFKFLKPVIDRINEFIPMLEREMPEWARKRAYETRDRAGFIIWTEEGTP